MMKLLGISLIVVGILCFAYLVTGGVAWTTPVAQDATPVSVADMTGSRMLVCMGLGLLSIIAGIIALCRGGSSSHKRKLMVVGGLAACLAACSCSTAEQTRLKNNMTYKAAFYDLIMQLNVDSVAHKKALQVLQVPFEQGKDTFYNNLVIDGEALTMFMASGQSTNIVENGGRFAFAALMKNGKLIDLVSPENVVRIVPLQERTVKWDERKVILLCQPPGGFCSYVEYHITKSGFEKIDSTK